MFITLLNLKKSDIVQCVIKNVITASGRLLYMGGKHVVIVGKLSMKIGPTFPDILNKNTMIINKLEK